MSRPLPGNISWDYLPCMVGTTGMHYYTVLHISQLLALYPQRVCILSRIGTATIISTRFILAVTYNYTCLHAAIGTYSSCQWSVCDLAPLLATTITCTGGISLDMVSDWVRL